MKSVLKLALVSLGLVPYCVISQTNAMGKWQQQHPEVECISYETFNALSEKERAQLSKVPLLLFFGELNENDINLFAAKHGLKGVKPAQSPEAEREVKEWLVNHREVKIVKRSEFLKETENVQEELLKCSHCLVLKGEVVTLDDVQLFGN